MRKPLCIDLYAGLGGWAEGFLSEGYDVVGFDIERHVYGAHSYPGQLVLQNVLTLEGSQFKGAAVIVASPPCQEFSRYAMPFGALWREHQQMDDDGGPAFNYQGKPAPYTGLFWACFRIAREAGVPLVVENVKGAERFVGSAKCHFGSYYLWGDVPALMPMTLSTKRPGRNFHAHENGLGSSSSFNRGEHETRGLAKWAAVDTVKCHGQKHGTEYAMTRGPGGLAAMGVKQAGSGPEWWDKALDERRKEATAVKSEWDNSVRGRLRRVNSNSSRKAASAMIAKIPFELSAHIARHFKPRALRQENRASFSVA